MEFKLRNQVGLHCRFCKTSRNNTFNPNLYETSPVKGVVCEDCKYHLEEYLNRDQN